jgi:digeranylgeranylglycerophospholipid reductase
MTKTYNTIVIGAGLAGLNAARFLEDEALVLDRKAELGRPVRCGEGISLHALQREGIEIQSDWIMTSIKKVKRIMPNGTCVGEEHKEPYAFVINKEKFEKYFSSLVPWEIKLNTRVSNLEREGQYWKVSTSQKKVYLAKYVIGADGPASIVARTVYDYRHSLMPAINHTLSFEKAIVSDELQMYFGNQIAPKGYAWIFPYTENSANVGIFIKTKESIKKYYKDFLAHIVEPLYGSYEIDQNKSGVLPSGGFRKTLAKDNTFLVGDAGSFTDPIFEGGNNLALLTGRLAAESINNNDPNSFQTAIDSFPFTGQDLLRAQQIFYGFDDETLNQLGELLDNKSSSYLNTDEGKEAFMSKEMLRKYRDEIVSFFIIWQTAKDYLW